MNSRFCSEILIEIHSNIIKGNKKCRQNERRQIGERKREREGGREGGNREIAIADNKRIARRIEGCSVWYEGLRRSLSQQTCVKLVRSTTIRVQS